MKQKIVWTATAAFCMSFWGGAALAQDDAKDNKTAMVVVKDVENMEIAPWGDDIPAYFEDVVETYSETAPMTCALFRMEKGTPLVYEYDYDDVKIILEGSMTLEDGKKTINATKGDVIYIPNGATIKFTSDDYGVGWACGQR